MGPNTIHIRRLLTITAGIAVVLTSAPLTFAARPTRGVKQRELPQVTLINEHIRAGWKDYQITPSRRATDGEWCRRVYLDILGRIPTVEELQKFTSSRQRDKRRALVDELLEGEHYTEEYARNWTTLWTNTLIGRTGGTERNSLTSRAGLQKYLRDSFARDKPYDKMVFELVTATGSTTPGSERFNGATNFLASKVNDEKGTLATADTARIFLGLQIQCTQCHNHPFNDWKQRRFWQMNAFFRQTRALRRFKPGTRELAFAEVIDQDFAGEGGTPEEAEIYYELRNGELQVAYPAFVDGQEVARSGFVSDVRRRTELGKLVVESENLATAMVNRTWAHFLGHGFTKPIDDLGPHNPSSHPELLNALAEEFRQNSYNTKSLIRWITLSEPYALSSRTNATNAQLDDPALGEPPKFSRFYLRQMRAEELYESLLVATDADKGQGSYEDREAAKARWLRQFTIAFGTDEGGESTTFNGTIPQALTMFNGEFIKKAIQLDEGNTLRQVAQSNLKPVDKIHYLFQAGLARRATQNEINAAQAMLIASRGNAVEVMQDLWWAILNSNEFIMNH
jgi:hypothetical protein